MTPSSPSFSVGPIQFDWEGQTGFLRRIRFHGVEVLRGIYPAARTRDWATLPSSVESMEAESTPEGMVLRLQARTVGPEMNLAWSAQIDVHASGRIHYSWHAQALTLCTTNRTGLCILHPAEAAGAPCVIEHSQGSTEPGWFPSSISPHQPFSDIRAISHTVGNLQVHVLMQGEVFEMEDQRNWTDASFKTYGRPLEWPRPYTLAPGEKIHHSVTLTVQRCHTTPATTLAHAPAPTSAEIPLRIPGLGFTLPGPIPSSLRSRLQALRPSHVRVETTSERLMATLAWAQADAASLQSRLMIAVLGADKLVPGDIAPLPQVLFHALDDQGNAVSRETLAAWHEAGHTALATGTCHHFTEFNRHRPSPLGLHEHVLFGIHAQVHAEDETSILETLTQHSVVARSAHQIGGGRPVIVSPISLGRERNSVEPRLRTELGARWFRESLHQLSQSGCVDSATYFHAYGPAGFMVEDQVTPLERAFASLAGLRILPPNLHTLP